ncbi:DNA polymerase iota [Thalassophryne amazonica]|uniref:DNA polymerase iota n=1 Tax=Thalassophryne amazonica TaxID=390379 RepID=UPI001471C0CD|nr:DNA polymerase iota [Thalassophryne amazonica]
MCEMENGDEDVEEDGSEWMSSFTDLAASFSLAASGPSLNTTSPVLTKRVILHFDLDCFYAQVEMIRNPALRNVPLGIQQKNIMVTCNYVAREQGITKLMSLSDAKEKCPQLVLVNGEDLTPYREMSYKVTELLMSYCPLVERLGFDENFMDVTEMVEKRLAQEPHLSSCSFKGHVYNHSSAGITAKDHPRLSLGSHIAEELREKIYSELGLTGCAGIASNKLLAKLVSGTFKPNQQTSLLPENVSDLMCSLSSLRQVPGVGHQTAKRLQALGLVSVKELHVFPIADLVREFGGPSAHRLKNLALGIDESVITPTGAPQSLSDEDSFKKISSTKDVLEKIQELLSSLLERMHKDGRQPQTFRLTIRRYSATNKWFSRESRQCPIPNHTGQKITSGHIVDAVVQLLPLAMKLFHKMIDSSASFHLTLINVCFTNLQTKELPVSGKGSITAFFTKDTSLRKSQNVSQNQEGSSQSAESHCTDHRFSTDCTITSPKTDTEADASCKAALHGFITTQSSVVCAGSPQLPNASCSTASSDCAEAQNTLKKTLPPYVDPEVFRLLPEEIQKELLSAGCAHTFPTTLRQTSSPCAPTAVCDTSSLSRRTSLQHPTPFTHTSPSSANSQNPKDRKADAKKSDLSDRATAVNKEWPPGPSGFSGEMTMNEQALSYPSSCDCEFPVDVDPKVFCELPPDVQRELMSEWKQHKPVLKSAPFKKPWRSLQIRDKKTASKNSQANSLLKYFKPG